MLVQLSILVTHSHKQPDQKNVGQMSDLIQEYRESTDKPTRDGWESFYNDRIGLDKIDIATDKTWDYVQESRRILIL